MPIDIDILERLKNKDPLLTSLDLCDQKLNAFDIQELIKNLKDNPYLVTLDLSENPIKDEEAILLAQNINNLISLTLRCTQISEKGAIALAQHPTLTTLDLSQNHIGNTGAIALAKNTVLNTLNIASNQINHEGTSAFIDSTLESLDLSENQVNDMGAVLLGKNKSLTTLNLASNQIADIGASALAQHPTLRVLLLPYNNVTMEGVKALLQYSKLTSLNLNYNKTLAEGAKLLGENATLTSLSLVGNDINNIGIEELAKNNILTSLDISYNQITDEGAISFIHNQSLNELIISYNQLSVKTAEVLANHPKLQMLRISHNFLGDEGVIALAKNKHITWLDAAGNQIGPKGAKALSENTSLKRLVLTTNLLGDEGAVELSKNKTLFELQLSYNQIKDKGAIELAQNQTLKILNLDYNYIGSEGRKALTQNKTLQTLFISDEQPPEFTEENLDTIFLLTQDLLCIRGFDDAIQFVNPAFSRVLGYEDNELLRKPLAKFVHPDDRNIKAEFLIKEQQKFPILQHAVRYRSKSGAYRLIQWTSRTKHQRIYSSGVDITEQKQSENKLIRTKRREEIAQIHAKESALYGQKQADFIAHLCHEVRNPLQGLYGNWETIKEHFEKLETLLNLSSSSIPISVKEEMNNEYKQIKSSLNDMEICMSYQETILNDNLDVSKMAENKLQLANKVIDIKAIICDIYKMLRTKADKKGLTLNMVLPEETLTVKGDCSRIKQIIINLASNAIKFTEKGRIDITLIVHTRTSSHTRFEIQVADTGIGLSEEEANKLFARFSQATVNTSDQYGGSGLGLVIAKKLANLMAGDITVESKKDQGTIFHCIIQCENLLELEQNKEEAIALASKTATTLPKFSRKPKILIVEDNEFNRKLLYNMLTNTGHECVVAVDGRDAIEKFTLYPVDLVLMDIVMPNLDGISATKKIRQYENEKKLIQVPILGLTGNAMEEQRIKALEAGMNDYLTKPYKKEEILQKITTLLILNIAIEKTNLGTISESPKLNMNVSETFSEKLSELEKNLDILQETKKVDISTNKQSLPAFEHQTHLEEESYQTLSKQYNEIPSKK